MTTSTRIFLLRHGETLWNTERRLQGHKDSKLTLKGQEQASHNGLQLRNFLSSAPRLISSPLGRCRETAALVAKSIDFAPSQIEYDDRVKELSIGRWEGQITHSVHAFKARSRKSSRIAWHKSANRYNLVFGNFQIRILERQPDEKLLLILNLISN